MKGIEIRREETGLGLVNGVLGVFLGGGSEDLEAGDWPDLVLPAVGGVGVGESNEGDGGELDNFHLSFCFFLAAFLSQVVLYISISSKVRRALKSARASIAMVTLPWTRIWARCSRVAEVLEGSITDMALELQQQWEERIVRRRKGEEARRRAAST